MRAPEPRHTPTVPGYLVGVLVALLSYGPLVLLRLLFDGGVLQYLTGAALLTLFAILYGLPIALIGVLVVHRTCRRVPSQAVHVAVAGVVGLIGAGLLLGIAYGVPPHDPLVLMAGVAAAFGREVACRFVPDS